MHSKTACQGDGGSFDAPVQIPWAASSSRHPCVEGAPSWKGDPSGVHPGASYSSKVVLHPTAGGPCDPAQREDKEQLMGPTEDSGNLKQL